jgi:hypothetical protein
MTSQQSLEDEPIRVSIAQRLIPSLAYSITALGGGFGALFLIHAMMAIHASEEIDVVASALTNAFFSLTVSLLFGVVVGLVGILMYVGTLFGNRKTSSPSVLYILVPGFLGILPHAVSWRLGRLILLAPYAGTNIIGMSKIMYLALTGAIVLAVLTPIAGLIMSLLRVTSLPGRKFGPLILMMVFEIIMTVSMGMLMYQNYSRTLGY